MKRRQGVTAAGFRSGLQVSVHHCGLQRRREEGHCASMLETETQSDVAFVIKASSPYPYL